MKRTLLFLAALAVVLFTSGKCTGGSSNRPGDPADPGQEAVDTTPTPAAVDLIVMVYSNAYDGFLNVREQPDVKSKVIGKILNGPMGAIKMGEVGEWTIVKVGETIGYASSRYLQTEPTPEFTDADMEKCLLGIWMRDTPMDQRVIVLFKNGIFAEGFTIEGWLQVGEWSVKGNVLEMNFNNFCPPDGSGWEAEDEREMWTVVNGDQLKDASSEKYKRQSLISAKSYAERGETEIGEGDWYVLDQEHYDLFYEQVHLRAKGGFPGE